jgi:hypothetical protein
LRPWYYQSGISDVFGGELKCPLGIADELSTLRFSYKANIRLSMIHGVWQKVLKEKESSEFEGCCDNKPVEQSG